MIIVIMLDEGDNILAVVFQGWSWKVALASAFFHSLWMK